MEPSLVPDPASSLVCATVFLNDVPEDRSPLNLSLKATNLAINIPGQSLFLSPSRSTSFRSHPNLLIFSEAPLVSRVKLSVLSSLPVQIPSLATPPHWSMSHCGFRDVSNCDVFRTLTITSCLCASGRLFEYSANSLLVTGQLPVGECD